MRHINYDGLETASFKRSSRKTNRRFYADDEIYLRASRYIRADHVARSIAQLEDRKTEKRKSAPNDQRQKQWGKASLRFVFATS